MLRNLSMFDGDFPITAGHCIPFGVRDPDGARSWTWMLFHVPSVPSYPLVMTNIANWKMTIEIVDLPSYKMVIFHSYVTLPEGIYIYICIDCIEYTCTPIGHRLI